MEGIYWGECDIYKCATKRFRICKSSEAFLRGTESERKTCVVRRGRKSNRVYELLILKCIKY